MIRDMAQHHPVQSDQSMLITSVTRNRAPVFQNGANAREAIETLYDVQNLHPFFLYAFVIMPDHCHFLLKVPSPGTISKVMNVYKGCCSMRIGKGSIWQRGFHVRIVHDVPAVIDYIHLNPVRRDLVICPGQYPWSSACGLWDVSSIDWQ
jgi:REP element-mobilizing transposase RayT